MTVTTSPFGTSFILRQTVEHIRSELGLRQREIATGKAADLGQTLGVGIESLISLTQQNQLLDGYVEANKALRPRLEAAQTALDDIRAGASAMRNTTLFAIGQSDRTSIVNQSRDALNNVIARLNMEVTGEHIFGGVNSGQAPMSDYFAPGSLSRQTVASTFMASFGMAHDDPGVSAITPSAMSAYLNGPFNDLFEDPKWGALWSSASNSNITVTISPDEDINASANSNIPAVRKLVMAYAMLSDSGLEQLGHETAQIVADRAVTLAANAIDELTGVEAQIGMAQSRIEIATEHMGTFHTMLSKSIGEVENVDPYAAAARVNELQIQLEAAYSLTARLQQLSLAKFL